MIPERLATLREQMRKDGLDALIVPQLDPHQSEYLAAHWQARRYFSGFTGSAGTLVLTMDKALLWTDSRYFLQAAKQLEGTGIELMKDMLLTTPSIKSWLADNLKAGDTVGVDGMLYSAEMVKALEKELAAKGIKLNTSVDPVAAAWEGRPDLPLDKVFIHDEKYAGESARSKMERLMKDVHRQGADAVLISALDEIAWILNIRSNDVKYNPVATSYLYMSDKDNILFIDPRKLTEEVIKYLDECNVRIEPYESLLEVLASLPKNVKVLVETAKTAKRIVDTLEERVVPGSSVAAYPKAIKNPVQIEGFRKAMERDGVALVKAVMEIQKRVREGVETDEVDVADILRKYRSQQPLFFDISFGSIIGYRGHGAVVHYEPTKEVAFKLEPGGLLLMDSGAQYLDGTTDITRTIALGTPTEQEKRDFTLMTKGHIAMAQAVFPQGTYGVQLDILAHQFLWKAGLNYLHGTGHGIGHFLNVHEGPQSIRNNYIPSTIELGMVTSNEPGLYREGLHGVRSESLMLTVKAMETEFGNFYKFETITLFPLDLNLFDTTIMTDDEIGWVNGYHTMVREKLLPLLDTEEEKRWLITATGTLVRQPLL